MHRDFDSMIRQATDRLDSDQILLFTSQLESVAAAITEHIETAERTRPPTQRSP